MAINLNEQKPKQNKRSNQTSSVKSLHFLAQDLEKNLQIFTCADVQC